MSLILSGTDGLSDVDGTAATPAIRGTDANTGIFFPAADTIAFAEGGVESMRIDSSGNVGIGTGSNTILSTLQLQTPAQTSGEWEGKGLLIKDDTAANSGLALYSRSSEEHYIASLLDGANSYLILGARKSSSGNQVNVMTLRGSGNVGVGTDSPAAKLDVVGTIKGSTTIGVGAATPSTSGAGITFPATQSASSNANTLDDYEEGTWTATMVPSTSGTITLSNNGGTYTKIGRTVTINATLKVSSVLSPVGYFTIQGLPFSGGAGATFRCSISILGDAMETTMTTSITASMQSGTSLYVFKYNGTGSQANCAQDVKANSEFFIGGTYTTD